MRIIKLSRKSLLFHLEQVWNKKESSCSFDVTMSSYDGAELCKLIGIFTQSLLQNIINMETMDLCRDGGLTYLKKLVKKQIKLKRK